MPTGFCRAARPIWQLPDQAQGMVTVFGCSGCVGFVVFILQLVDVQHDMQGDHICHVILGTPKWTGPSNAKELFSSLKANSMLPGLFWHQQQAGQGHHVPQFRLRCPGSVAICGTSQAAMLLRYVRLRRIFSHSEYRPFLCPTQISRHFITTSMLTTQATAQRAPSRTSPP